MPKQPPAAEIRLSTACIIAGTYYRAGEVLPFAREEDLPENLRPLVGVPGVEAFDPCERDYYSPELRRHAAQIRGNVQWQATAEELAEQEQRLPPEVQEVLEDKHSRRTEKLRAQMAYNKSATDAVYEAASAEAAAQEIKFFVRRGGEMAAAERARLKPGEKCFMRQGDDWVFAGVINSNGEPPPQPITT